MYFLVLDAETECRLNLGLKEGINMYISGHICNGERKEKAMLICGEIKEKSVQRESHSESGPQILERSLFSDQSSSGWVLNILPGVLGESGVCET